MSAEIKKPLSDQAIDNLHRFIAVRKSSILKRLSEREKEKAKEA
ncbi:hypothetical protein [Gorillibacterium sp. sgz5001074]